MTTAAKTAPKAKAPAEKAKSAKAPKAKARKALDTVDRGNDTLNETLAAATAAEAERAPKAKTVGAPDAGDRDGDERAAAAAAVAAKLRKPAAAAKAADVAPKRSMLDAAAEVLAGAAEPMACTALIDAMSERKLWTSPNGKTPEATLNAALQREIKVKGDASRFRKAGRGLFAVKA